jgi:uncharacterized protein
MAHRTNPWPPGMPCWTDLSSPDVAAAKDFYTAVLGWAFEDADEEYGGYTIAQVDGGAVAGIGPQDETAPVAWTLYLASDDVDATAAAISSHGGTLLVAPGDVGPTGRMCLALDPTGAAFGVWQHGTHLGAALVNQPGALTWEDLRSSDAAAAHEFYRSVFGYRLQPLADAPAGYSLFHLGDEETPLGGMGGLMDEPEGTPSHWIVYFGVVDADTAAATVTRAGGTVLSAPIDTPYGRMAPVRDPWGALFWIVQDVEGARPPDRSG